MGVVGESKRPAAIEAFIILNGLGTLLMPLLVIGYFADPSVPRWYPPFLSVYSLTILLCLVGIWQMLRKPFFVYVLAVMASQTVHLILHRWNPMGLLLPLFLIAAVLVHVRKLR